MRLPPEPTICRLIAGSMVVVFVIAILVLA